jgi:hypothetical protein
METSSNNISPTKIVLGVGLGVLTIAIILTAVYFSKQDKETLTVDEIDEGSPSSTSQPTSTGGGQVKNPVSEQKPEPGIKFGDLDKIWEYRKQNGVWFTRRKGNTQWLSLASNDKATKLLNQTYPKG